MEPLQPGVQAVGCKALYEVRGLMCPSLGSVKPFMYPAVAESLWFSIRSGKDYVTQSGRSTPKVSQYWSVLGKAEVSGLAALILLGKK